VAAQYERLTQLQRLLFKHHPSLRELALANCGTLQKRSLLQPALEGLPEDELRALVTRQLRHAARLVLPMCWPLCRWYRDSEWYCMCCMVEFNDGLPLRHTGRRCGSNLCAP
jgi:hypothetical protein